MAIFVQEGQTANALLTAIFFALVVGTFTTTLTPGWLPPGCPLSPSEAVAAILAACVSLFPLIFLVKRLGGALVRTPFSPYVAPRFPHMSEINSLFSLFHRAPRARGRCWRIWGIRWAR